MIVFSTAFALQKYYCTKDNYISSVAHLVITYYN